MTYSNGFIMSNHVNRKQVVLGNPWVKQICFLKGLSGEKRTRRRQSISFFGNLPSHKSREDAMTQPFVEPAPADHTTLLRLAFDLPGSVTHVSHLRMASRCYVESVGLSKEDVDDLELLLGELSTNVVRHAEDRATMSPSSLGQTDILCI